jgi:hypothetical protein
MIKIGFKNSKDLLEGIGFWRQFANARGEGEEKRKRKGIVGEDPYIDKKLQSEQKETSSSVARSESEAR